MLFTYLIQHISVYDCRRAIAQRCPTPPMLNLISVGGQHQGKLIENLYIALYIYNFFTKQQG